MDFRIRRPAWIAALSGANGDSPAAMRSALTKTGQSASCGKNSRAKVVFPAPLGPAMMKMRGCTMLTTIMGLAKKQIGIWFGATRPRMLALSLALARQRRRLTS